MFPASEKIYRQSVYALDPEAPPVLRVAVRLNVELGLGVSRRVEEAGRLRPARVGRVGSEEVQVGEGPTRGLAVAVLKYAIMPDLIFFIP